MAYGFVAANICRGLEMTLVSNRSEQEAPADLIVSQPDSRVDPVMFTLILKFLQTPGQVLLVQ